MKILREDTDNALEMTQEDKAIAQAAENKAPDELTIKDNEASMLQGLSDMLADQGVDIESIPDEQADKIKADLDRFAQADLDRIANLSQVDFDYQTSNPSNIEKAMLTALRAVKHNNDADAILRQSEENGVGTSPKKLGNSDFPNLLIHGLAGFGKTAEVKAFCKAHNLNCVMVPSSSLNIEDLTGLPFPVKDDETGSMKQASLPVDFWDQLDKPNSILVLDEYNRARPDVANSLLQLINEHYLISKTIITDKEIDKNTQEKKRFIKDGVRYFPNLLFTIACINPRGNRVYNDVKELQPQEVSRFYAVGVEPDKKVLKRVLTELYTPIVESLLNLLKTVGPDAIPGALDLYNRYNGQLEIAKKVLNDRGVHFDTLEDTERGFGERRNQASIFVPLNYRSFTMALKACDGTRSGFQDVISTMSGFGDDRISEIQSALAGYSDNLMNASNAVFAKAKQAYNNAGAQTQAKVSAAARVLLKKTADEVSANLASLMDDFGGDDELFN